MSSFEVKEDLVQFFLQESSSNFLESQQICLAQVKVQLEVHQFEFRFRIFQLKQPVFLAKDYSRPLQAR